jgi:Ca2+-binding EF-hand superfamily protein
VLPTAEPSSSSSQWAASPEELERYRATFDQIDTSGSGIIGPDEGRQVLESSGLPVEELSYIWELSDVNEKGHLTRGEFVVAMILVARRRRGVALPPQRPPELEVHLGGGLPASSNSVAPSDEAVFIAEADEVERYLNVFQDADVKGAGYLGPDESREILESSGLPVEELKHIWKLSDISGAGQLAPNEFVVAMALTARRRQGAALPPTLPQSLLDSVNRWARR